MSEDFVTLEQAVQLKELGFDRECNHYYDTETKELVENHNDYSPEDSFSDCSAYDNHNHCWNCVSVPFLAEAQKWLREVKGIHIEIRYVFNPQYEPWVGRIVMLGDQPESELINTDTCDSYEEALLEGIDMVLKILKK